MKTTGVIWAGLILIALTSGGCVQTYETDSYDRGSYVYGPDEDAPASSLFEVTFGDGDTRVTKNLPADAVNTLGEAVRSARE